MYEKSKIGAMWAISAIFLMLSTFIYEHSEVGYFSTIATMVMTYFTIALVLYKTTELGAVVSLISVIMFFASQINIWYLGVPAWGALFAVFNSVLLSLVFYMMAKTKISGDIGALDSGEGNKLHIAAFILMVVYSIWTLNIGYNAGTMGIKTFLWGVSAIMLAIASLIPLMGYADKKLPFGLSLIAVLFSILAAFAGSGYIVGLTF
jgi:hypothetical protein